MKKLLFIFNPLSGMMKIQRKLFEVVDYYSRRGFLVTCYPTKRTHDGYEYLKGLTESYDLIVCSGGDGTLNEIVSALLDSGKTGPLAYLPAGSTNDFGRSIGLSTEIGQALRVFETGHPVSVDIGCFNDRRFIYVAAFGIFTNVSFTTPQDMKNMIGHAAYLLESMKAVTELKSTRMTLTWDGGIVSGDFVLGMISNSSSVAGIQTPMLADTVLNDGLFEVTLVRMPKNVIDLQDILFAYLTGGKSDNLVCFRSAHLEIDSENAEWTLDGENGGWHTHAVIDVIPRAVKILASGRIPVGEKAVLSAKDPADQKSTGA